MKENMKNEPLVSVILLSYNQSDYIESSINSVIEQVYKNWELIIIDNGSNDESHSIIKKYSLNKKIKIFLHDSNICLGKRMNDGIDAASGDLISLLYSDDYYLPEKLHFQVNEINKLSPDWGMVYGPGYRLDMSTKKFELKKTIEFSGDILKKLFSDFDSGFINPISPLIRKECFIKYPFYEDVFIESEAILFRMAIKYKFFYMDLPLVVMRDTGRNAGYAAKQNSEFFAIVLDKLGKVDDFPSKLYTDYRNFKARIYKDNAWQNIRSGTDSLWVRNMIYKSISSNWKEIFNPKIFIAYVMSFYPVIVRRKINLLVNKIINKKSDIYFEHYYAEIPKRERD